MPSPFAVILVAASFLPILAQPRSPTEELTFAQKAEAAKLADEGMFLFNKGDFTQAAEKFEQAEHIVAAPTIVLAHGRALEKLGRWVDAAAKFRLAADFELSRSAAWQQRTAKADAEKELARLEPTIPRVLISITPTTGGEVDFSLDGRKRSLPGSEEPISVDPGKHVVFAKRADGSEATSEVTLLAGQTLNVQLSLRKEVVVVEGPGMHPIKLAGWIGIGVSGAALVVATATGIPAIVMAGDLEDRCPEGQCPPGEDLGSYDGLRWTAGISLVAGALIAGGGVAAILLSPEPHADSAVTLSPWARGEVAGLELRFP